MACLLHKEGRDVRHTPDILHGGCSPGPLFLNELYSMEGGIMDKYGRKLIRRIEAGEEVDMDSTLKNYVNAAMADRFKKGDRVQVIRTGETGTIVRKIVYDRKNQDWFSPKGYTAIQVRTARGTYCYAGRSLRLLGRTTA